MEDCVFCKIVDKSIPADIVYENEKVVVFKDNKPKAPLHLLAVPRKHIATVNDIKEEDKDLMGELFLAVIQAAERVGIRKKGYKLAINVEKGGGQEVFHLHIHLLGGWKNDKKS